MNRLKSRHILLLFYSIFIFNCLFFYFKNKDLVSAQQNLKKMLALANTSTLERKAYHSFLKKYNKPISSVEFSTFIFLNNEIEKIENILKEEPSLTSLNNRLSFLKNENYLSFSEKTNEKTNYMQESLLQLQGSIQLNNDDLKRLLLLIETPNEKPCPQLIIKKISVIKEKDSLKNDILLLKELEILKREFFI